MSNSTQSLPTPTGAPQAHFGGPPGSSDLAAECKKWENLCGELLAEREKLRAELMHTRREYDTCRKSLFHLVFKGDRADFDPELAVAHVNDKPTIEELLAGLERTPGK
jgi:hypothetical protein